MAGRKKLEQKFMSSQLPNVKPLLGYVYKTDF